MKNIYLIVGKSGSGKDTIVNAICEKYGYKRLVSYTTRQPRKDPKDIQSHIFVDVEDYLRDKENGCIVAETFYNGNYYWATKEQVDESDFYIIDIQGVKSLKELYHNKPIVVIAIDADVKTRVDRMKLRGDSLPAIAARVELDESEFVEIEDIMDFIISNSKLKNGQDLDIESLSDYLYTTIMAFENRKNNDCSTTCIDCNRIGIDENGRFCPKTREFPNKMSLLSDITKAVNGYKETDTVPISGRLLYDIYAVLTGQI